MKNKLKVMLAASLFTTVVAFAQQQAPPRPQGGGQGGSGPRPPAPPLVATLDANGDAIIDANEIANASQSLKKLDKNGDGQLTGEELRPSRPAGEGHNQVRPPGQRREEGSGSGSGRSRPNKN